jgi:hypothetical protein
MGDEATMEPLSEAMRRIAKAMRQSKGRRSTTINVRRPINVRTAINVGSPGSHESAVANQSVEIRQDSGRQR